jgi:tripartite-type tricarboxylate transporter receptor subunit TctC
MNAARRAPDGYNRFFGAVHHTIAESLYTRLPYGLEKDFEPVTVAAFVPNVVVVHPRHKDRLKTLKDLVDYARANPDKLNYGSAGSGTTHHLSVELFKTMTQTTTERRLQITPAARSSASCAAVLPRSPRNTSSVCSPSSGGPRR